MHQRQSIGVVPAPHREPRTGAPCLSVAPRSRSSSPGLQGQPIGQASIYGGIGRAYVDFCDVRKLITWCDWTETARKVAGAMRSGRCDAVATPQSEWAFAVNRAPILRLATDMDTRFVLLIRSRNLLLCVSSSSTFADQSIPQGLPPRTARLA